MARDGCDDGLVENHAGWSHGAKGAVDAVDGLDGGCVALAGGQLVEVIAGAEGVACAGEDAYFLGRVFAEGLEGFGEEEGGGVVNGVADLGAVDGDDGDAF